MEFDFIKSVMRKARFKPDKKLTYYHVMTRTAQQSFLLSGAHDPDLKKNLDHIIVSMARVFYVQIFAHVYMDNHYHLALSIAKPSLDPVDVQQRFERLQEQNAYPTKWQPEYLEKAYARFTDLSSFMSEVNRRIAQVHNRRHGTTGHFWGGRFKSIIIENEAALLRVMTYIEQNPVRAEMCNHPSEYPWCSAGARTKQLAKGDEPAIPKIGPFQHEDCRIRAKHYVDWMDYHADRILSKEVVIAPSHQDLPKSQLNPEELKDWREDFESRRPTNWRKVGYGSDNFEESIANEAKSLQLARTLERGGITRGSPGARSA